MVDLKQVVDIEAGGERVLEAVSTIDGLSRWWLKRVDGDASLGGRIEMGPEHNRSAWRVTERDDSTFEIECVEKPREEDWLGTRVRFEVVPTGQGTQLRFQHLNWRDESDFFGHCNFWWAYYLHGLRSYLEGGAGRPT